jgi:hypothetical protein
MFVEKDWVVYVINDLCEGKIIKATVEYDTVINVEGINDDGEYYEEEEYHVKFVGYENTLHDPHFFNSYEEVMVFLLKGISRTKDAVSIDTKRLANRFSLMMYLNRLSSFKRYLYMYKDFVETYPDEKV